MDEPATDRIESGESPLVLAEELRAIYAAFDENIANLTHGDNIGKAVGDNLLSWIGTGKYKHNREELCNRLNQDVQSQLSKLLAALETARRSEAEEACAIAARTVLAPVPQDSNRTEDLMRRAVAAQIRPLLPYFSRETLEACLADFQKAYPKRMRFPAERDLVREMERLLQ